MQGSVGGESFRLQGGRPCFSRLRGLSKNTGQRENVALTAAIKSIPFPQNTNGVSKAPSQKSKAGLNTCLLLIEKLCLSSYKEFYLYFNGTNFSAANSTMHNVHFGYYDGPVVKS